MPLPLIIDAPDRAGLERVHTTALLPSGAVLSLTRRVQGAGRYLLTDEGAGAEDARALGHLELSSADTRRGRAIAEQFGLDFLTDTFQARDVSEAQLYAAVIQLAEATRRWATEMVEGAARRRHSDLLDEVEERVRRALVGVGLERGRKLMGDSLKQYDIDLVARLPEERLIIFETVTPTPAALSSAHLKLFDLKAAYPDWPREVVTERLADWSQPDLVLLSGVSTHVRDFSRPEWTDLGTLLQ